MQHICNMTPKQKKQNEEKNVYVANKEIARMAKAAVKETACGKINTNKRVESFCFDLQKELQILFGETGNS